MQIPPRSHWMPAYPAALTIKTRVDEETGASLRRRATAAGCQVSELVREAVYLIEHGMT